MIGRIQIYKNEIKNYIFIQYNKNKIVYNSNNQGLNNN